MLHDLVHYSVVDETLAEISEVLGADVRTLDSTDALHSPVSVQLAIFAAGVSTARALLRSGVQPLAVAGLSLGAFSAAVVAEAIELSDAVRLVRSRAEQMKRMYPTGYGLAAIVGLSEAHVIRLVASANTTEHPVFVGNINAPKQIVIAGSVEGMKAVLEKALLQGARKTELLDVPVPSHCPLLQPIADSLRTQMEAISIKDPKVIYIANVNARAVRTAKGIADDLADNIAHGVRWHDATSVAQELGCEPFLQLPPGHTLKDLAQENLANANANAITPDNFDRLSRLAMS